EDEIDVRQRRTNAFIDLAPQDFQRLGVELVVIESDHFGPRTAEEAELKILDIADLTVERLLDEYDRRLVQPMTRRLRVCEIVGDDEDRVGTQERVARGVVRI